MRVYKSTRWVVVRTQDWPPYEPPTVVGRFKLKRHADAYAWHCAITYFNEHFEFTYSVYPVAWEVERQPS
jgi:hypothetical protein